MRGPLVLGPRCSASAAPAIVTALAQTTEKGTQITVRVHIDFVLLYPGPISSKIELACSE